MVSELSTHRASDLEVQIPRKTLRITAWNILAQVWVEDKLYPFIGSDIYAAPSRRLVLRRRLGELNSDVFFLNEVEERELHALLHDDPDPLHHNYDFLFVKYPERMWSQVGVEAVPWGVAIIWRRSVLVDVKQDPTELSGRAPPAAFIRGTLASCGKEILLATAHLDGDGCPPSVKRSQAQLMEVANLATQKADGCLGTVWGGDCNLTLSAPAVAKVRNLGFEVASELNHMPTAFPVVGGSRLDHVFAKGGLVPKSTHIPECPRRHCCPLAPCNGHSGMHGTQVLLDYIGLSYPRVPGCYLRLIGCLLLIPWIFTMFCCFVIPVRLSWQRCRWALMEWGSDHLPVTVEFEVTEATE